MLSPTFVMTETEHMGQLTARWSSTNQGFHTCFMDKLKDVAEQPLNKYLLAFLKGGSYAVHVM